MELFYVFVHFYQRQYFDPHLTNVTTFLSGISLNNDNTDEYHSATDRETPCVPVKAPSCLAETCAVKHVHFKGAIKYPKHEI